ncbi:MAG: lycopene cyclase domain-containing protein [Chloroflexota bacterium]|nr:MAG: lycopene cyclase domain-containing protein [Chloroflexota bacterium]
MTYFGFIGLFLAIPISLLAIITYIDHRRGRRLPERLSYWPAWAAILLHMVIALLYTTLWDNYLVATRVWWYDPELVTGITIGYVPIEEYTFFLVQPLLAGLWLFFLARRIRQPAAAGPLKSSLRWTTTAVLALVWLASVVALVGGWGEATYMALELGWALPPIGLQLLFGADILWRYRRLAALSLVSLTLYLSAADAVAINLGTWTINPDKSFDLLLGGILPVEEFLFFLLTNTLITFGITLVVARESHQRFGLIRQNGLKGAFADLPADIVVEPAAER